jgi:hypothetical protein
LLTEAKEAGDAVGSRMTDDRFAKLDALGFIWDTWQRLLQDMEKEKAEFEAMAQESKDSKGISQVPIRTTRKRNEVSCVEIFRCREEFDGTVVCSMLQQKRSRMTRAKPTMPNLQASST